MCFDILSNHSLGLKYIKSLITLDLLDSLSVNNDK